MTLDRGRRSTTVRKTLILLVARGERAAWISRYAVSPDGVDIELQLVRELCGPPKDGPTSLLGLVDDRPGVTLSAQWSGAVTRTVQLDLGPPGVALCHARLRAQELSTPPGGRQATLSLMDGRGDAERWRQDLWASPIPASGDLVVAVTGVAGAARPARLDGEFLREMAARLSSS